MSRKDKTMISASVIQTDSFASLSRDAQLLWFHLNPEADHYGILANIGRSMRAAGFGADKDGKQPALESLIEGGFILPLQPVGTLYAIADWWNMNQFNSRICKTNHGEEISEQLCFIGKSNRYALQSEAAETMRPTGELTYAIVPVYAPEGKHRASTEEVQDKYSTSICQSKANQSKGNATEEERQQQSISKPSQINKKESHSAGFPTGECPDCRATVLFTDYGTQRVFDCPSCGRITVDTETGERI